MSLNLEKSRNLEDLLVLTESVNEKIDIQEMHKWMMTNLSFGDQVMSLRLTTLPLTDERVQVGFDIARYKHFLLGYVATSRRVYEILPGMIVEYGRSPNRFSDLRPYPMSVPRPVSVFYPDPGIYKSIHLQVRSGVFVPATGRFSVHSYDFPSAPVNNGILIRNAFSKASKALTGLVPRASREMWLELVKETTPDKAMRKKLFGLRDDTAAFDPGLDALVEIWCEVKHIDKRPPEEVLKRIKEAMVRCLDQV